MSAPMTEILLKMRADGDPGAFVDWCAATQDPMAFRDALGRMEPAEWRGVHARLAESLAAPEADRPTSPSSNAADRDRRGRAVARALKLQILEQADAARQVRVPWRGRRKDAEPIGSPCRQSAAQPARVPRSGRGSSIV